MDAEESSAMSTPTSSSGAVRRDRAERTTDHAPAIGARSGNNDEAGQAALPAATRTSATDADESSLDDSHDETMEKSVDIRYHGHDVATPHDLSLIVGPQEIEIRVHRVVLELCCPKMLSNITTERSVLGHPPPMAKVLLPNEDPDTLTELLKILCPIGNPAGRPFYAYDIARICRAASDFECDGPVRTYFSTLFYDCLSRGILCPNKSTLCLWYLTCAAYWMGSARWFETFTSFLISKKEPSFLEYALASSDKLFAYKLSLALQETKGNMASALAEPDTSRSGLCLDCFKKAQKSFSRQKECGTCPVLKAMWVLDPKYFITLENTEPCAENSSSMEPPMVRSAKDVLPQATSMPPTAPTTSACGITKSTAMSPSTSNDRSAHDNSLNQAPPKAGGLFSGILSASSGINSTSPRPGGVLGSSQPVPKGWSVLNAAPREPSAKTVGLFGTGSAASSANTSDYPRGGGLFGPGPPVASTSSASNSAPSSSGLFGSKPPAAASTPAPPFSALSSEYQLFGKKTFSFSPQ